MNKKIFIDSNVLLYFLSSIPAQHVPAKALVGGLYVYEETGIISPYVVNEVHYIFSKQTKNLKEARKACNDVLSLSGIKLIDLKLDKADMQKIFDLSIKYNLKTTDAFHAYYCKKLKIKRFATFDTDFDKISWLKVIKPK